MKGVSKISVIDGKMNAQQYKQILQENLMSSIESFELPSGYVFSRIIIPRLQLNLRRSGCLKIMLMFWNGQVSPRI